MAIWGAALEEPASGAEFSCRDRVLSDHARPLEKGPSHSRPASFRQFARGASARQRIKIGIRGGKTFYVGETVVARIENRSSHEARLPLGPGLTVERLEAGRWTKIEAEEPPSVMFEDPAFLPEGRASRCSFFTIPPGPAAGPFRFSTVVETKSGKARRVTRQFVVAE